MTNDKRLLEVLVAIGNISNDRRLGFGQKLERILREVVNCMQAKSGSIMLLKGRKTLEVVASTRPELIGVKQRLDEESPSSWVVRNKAPFYTDRTTESKNLQKRFDHYEKDAFLVVPIISNNKVIGVLNVTEKIGADIFEKEEQEMLLRVAGQVISALENQRLIESLRKSRRTVQKKNRELMKLEALKTDLFNMLIHDLKGPISELVANLDILSYTVSDENRPYVESAQTGCDTLYRMVSNLLDLARLEEGNLKLLYEKIDPKDLIKEALARLFGLCKTKELRFVEKFSPAETGGVFWGDRGVLLRVLQNLLANAIQYSPPGETIEVGFHYLKSPEIEFFVKDHGPGVPAESQEAIFDKYIQLEKKKNGRMYTTGLGLTFCKMAVEAHRGKIGVKSETQKGSRFWFVLPLEHKEAGRPKR
ncbi:MAG: GAF domain-containing protein [Deltaproteobacteria bacterium]|nr:GAF domain-containing protein [Deltaproteobacteria bacterium]MBW2019252.1 GAF domain-containing protein [Deltaproteobacteria bacterium]MBW2074058.1 GAF domain-containing protein [Deltaproteobacteria bacterium]